MVEEDHIDDQTFINDEKTVVDLNNQLETFQLVVFFLVYTDRERVRIVYIKVLIAKAAEGIEKIIDYPGTLSVERDRNQTVQNRDNVLFLNVDIEPAVSQKRENKKSLLSGNIRHSSLHVLEEMIKEYIVYMIRQILSKMIIRITIHPILRTDSKRIPFYIIPLILFQFI